MNEIAPNYTTDYYGNIAVPVSGNRFLNTEVLPVGLGLGRVRAMARSVADDIISDARTLHGPVVWITGNSYFPALRSVTEAEQVWQAANNEDGELWAFFVELLVGMLDEANVYLAEPAYDNALYAVDLNRWQVREDCPDMADDINDEWEPVQP